MLGIHLDTDIGGDIDDLCALAMLLNCPGADLRAITTVSDDGGRRAGYARYALRLAGRADVPVAAGADISLGCYCPTPGLPDEATYWPEPVLPAPGPLDRTLTLLERSIRENAIIVAIGPYTNLALLEQRAPGILRSARLCLMGGYVFPPRTGFPAWGPDMDWNVQVDARSAHVVLRCAAPTLVPLSVTVETALRRADLPTLRQAGPLAQLIAHQAEAFAEDEGIEARYGRTCTGLPDDTINFLHDPLACAVALGWDETVKTSELRLRSEIVDGLLYQRIDHGGVPTRVVTQVDGAYFSELWLRTVVG
ncbi:MAG: nucleoside hydrolase [Anaerolineales bacterium]|nr:nucleoside hydrolase [Anaerolineales bacterium]